MNKNEWLLQYKGSISERDMALLERCYDVLQKNMIQGDMPWGSSPVISPWSGSDAGLWNWDSVFHAMTVVRFDRELAKSCIDSLGMFQRESGIIPDVIYPTGRVMDNYSKPPVFPWGALYVYERDGDKDFLSRNYERSALYEKFWIENRFDRGLFYYSAQENPEKDDYLHPRWESGWDNSPRWDESPIVEMYPVDLNCFMVLFYRSMAKMAEILGLDSSVWTDKELILSKNIEDTLFDVQNNTYADRNRITKKFSKVISPASFMPLFVGIASNERAEAMSALGRDSNKFYPGMPTVSYDCEGYDNDYWRGPTWLNVAFFAIKGLHDYGYEDIASDMKEFILHMVYENLPNICENYDSRTRIGKCCKEFSWSAAFIIEFILQM